MVAPLIIIIIAFGLILGFLSRKQAFNKLGRILIIAALSPVLISISKNTFSQLPSWQKPLVAIVFLAAGLFLILRILLGKDLFNNIAGNFIYDGLKAVITFPFRIISGMIRRYK